MPRRRPEDGIDSKKVTDLHSRLCSSGESSSEAIGIVSARLGISRTAVRTRLGLEKPRSTYGGSKQKKERGA